MYVCVCQLDLLELYRPVTHMKFDIMKFKLFTHHSMYIGTKTKTFVNKRPTGYITNLSSIPNKNWAWANFY